MSYYKTDDQVAIDLYANRVTAKARSDLLRHLMSVVKARHLRGWNCEVFAHNGELYVMLQQHEEKYSETEDIDTAALVPVTKDEYDTARAAYRA